MKKNIFLLTICITAISFLNGCGRVSEPEQAKDSFYPHTYIVQQSIPESED